MITIGAISQKGGSGKTTTILNLAVAAQQSGATVAVLDLDMQASANGWYQSRVGDDDLVVQAVHPAALYDTIALARKQGADFVFIDTAAKTESDAVAALEVSDIVLVPCKPSILDVRSIQSTVRLCQHRNVTPYIVLTQIEPQGTVAEETRDTLQQLGFNVLPEMLGRRVAYTHSLLGGQAVTEYEPRGKAAGEVRALFERVRSLVAAKASTSATTREEVPA